MSDIERFKKENKAPILSPNAYKVSHSTENLKKFIQASNFNSIRDSVRFVSIAKQSFVENCIHSRMTKSFSVFAAAKALNHSGIIAATNVLSNCATVQATRCLSSCATVQAARCLSSSTFLSKAMSSCTSVSRNMLETTALTQKLAKQLTLPPVYSASSIAAEISSKIVNPVSGAFTPEFSNLASEIREMPLDTFEYSFDDAGNAIISEQLEEKLSAIIDVNSAKPNSHRKVISKEFFYSVILPIVLALLQLSYSMHSSNQLTKQLEHHHQEEMSIQYQIFNEECQQTEYLRKIAESSEDSVPAKEDIPSSQTTKKKYPPVQCR